jgi:hypothetical protein
MKLCTAMSNVVQIHGIGCEEEGCLGTDYNELVSAIESNDVGKITTDLFEKVCNCLIKKSQQHKGEVPPLRKKKRMSISNEQASR